MYHRVLPEGSTKNRIQPGMYVQNDTFEQHLIFLKNIFEIVSLEQLMKDVGCSWRGSKPLCALTFDDGWLDFFSHAFPVLKTHQVPATVFLPTNYIGTDKWFWTDRLGHILHNKSLKSEQMNSFTYHPLTLNILKSSGTIGSRLEKAIALLKEYKYEEIYNILSELEECLTEKPEQVGRAFLNWMEVHKMAESGLVYFGSHTANHHILDTLPDDEIREELYKSRDFLLNQKVVSPEFIPFCYPNGNFDHNIAMLVKDAGYSLAVSTNSGWIGKKDDLFALKRIPVHDDITSTVALFACRLATIF